ncbi:MAG: tRNA 4-thiouridine(8) synthase ThiI [Acidobacteriia bacterium]|nr:tRNA 4-thiouridine(8) synthase ThiI [Terriglobia bacterium]
MAAAHIVVHYHELWLKGGNRDFFLSKLRLAMRRALDGLRIARITEPGDRYVIELLDDAELGETLERLGRVSGIANLGVARTAERDPENPLGPLCAAAWEEVRKETFASFAVRAKRSDKRFPLNALSIEREVGGYLHDQLQASGHSFRVDLRNPELTCRIEITPGPVLVYARRIPGAGGLPANTAGRLTCLLSGGFDSSVAAWKMMRRGAHVNFVHFWGGGAKPGESSVHVARELVKRLVPWQFTAKLYLVPFEPLQREIMRQAPEQYRILLYRRLMLRIAERVARGGRSLGLVTGDSLAQVASQTLQNMAAVGAVTHMPLYRPLVGDDKLEILEIAKKIGTHDISAEPFHDCCPVFLPKAPALFATAQELDAAEAGLNPEEMVRSGLQTLSVERYRYTQGRVIQVESLREATA